MAGLWSTESSHRRFHSFLATNYAFAFIGQRSRFSKYWVTSTAIWQTIALGELQQWVFLQKNVSSNFAIAICKICSFEPIQPIFDSVNIHYSNSVQKPWAHDGIVANKFHPAKKEYSLIYCRFICDPMLQITYCFCCCFVHRTWYLYFRNN